MDKKILEDFSIKVQMRRKIPQMDIDARRWLENGEIVSLSVNKRTSNNVEFKVNDDEEHLIWFSQLSTLYFGLKDLDLVSGEIVLKDGTQKLMCDLKSSEFIEIVKGRRFKVKCNSDGPVAKFDRNNSPCNTYIEYAKFIIDLLNKGESDKAAGYLSPATEYSLIEI